MREMLDGAVLEREGAALADARFVPLRWREEVAEKDRKLKIGWYVKEKLVGFFLQC